MRGTRAAQHELDAIDEHIAAQSALVSSHDLRLSQLRGQSEAAAQKRVAVGQEITRRELAVEQAQSRLAEARSALAEFETQSAHGDVPEEGLDEAYQTAQDTQAEAERLRDTARDQLHELEQERAGLDARMSALARSLDQRDASGAVLAAGTAGISGRVAEHVRVTEGFEAAIGAALGTFADALLADSAESAAEAVRSARENDLGRLRTVLGAGAGAGAGAGSGSAGAGSGSAGSGGESSDDAGRGLDPAPEIAGLTRAGDAVIAAPDGVRGFLSRSYIAASVDAAIAARSAITERFPHGGYTVVTFEGDVLTAHTLSGGSQQAPSRIELTAELEQAAARRNEVAEDIADLDAELAELRAAAAHAKTAAHESFAELRTADARLAEHAKERNRLVTRAELAAAEAERAAQALAAVAESARETESQAERAAAVLAAAESEPRPILDASQRDLAFGEVEAARAIELEARLALETARERSRVSAAQRDALAEQLASEQRAADEAARRAVLRARQVAQAERVAGLLPAILDACDRSLTEARLVQQRAEQERARHSQELTLLRSEDSTLRQQLQALTERVHGAELQSYERKLHLSALLERSGNELGLVEDVLIAEYGPDQPVPDLSGVGATAPGAGSASSSGAGAGARGGDSVESQFANRLEAELAAELGLTGPGSGPLEDASDPAPDAQAGESDSSRESVPTVPYVRVEQEKRLARAERRLAELGRINPLALEEFAALEQRHAFLSEQLQDLTKTRADLLSIIAELDEKMQGIFGEAFEDTRLAFAEVFPILFPGGSGEIALSNPDDLLNTGIEMVVKPAGKQVERMSLLSGGERSLAAVAWLMAIFQARPSPFYIVDEVEAALDDANLGRLLQVFERLRENSQLIIITHQKRTMEIADALYGVSMRQDGISAVVGQRIQKDDVERASA